MNVIIDLIKIIPSSAFFEHQMGNEVRKYKIKTNFKIKSKCHQRNATSNK